MAAAQDGFLTSSSAPPEGESELVQTAALSLAHSLDSFVPEADADSAEQAPVKKPLAAKPDNPPSSPPTRLKSGDKGYRIPKKKTSKPHQVRAISPKRSDFDRHGRYTGGCTSHKRLFIERDKRRLEARQHETNLYERCRACEGLGHTIDQCSEKYCQWCDRYGDRPFIDREGIYRCPVYLRKRDREAYEAKQRWMGPRGRGGKKGRWRWAWTCGWTCR